MDSGPSTPIAQNIIDKFRSRTLLDASGSPCFPVSGDKGASTCLLTSANVPTSSQPSIELGVLLRESFSSPEPWQKLLKKFHVPGAELLAFESQDNSRSSGGSAAGNLLWLAQSLGRTYSRTRELIKVIQLHLLLLAKMCV